MSATTLPHTAARRPLRLPLFALVVLALLTSAVPADASSPRLSGAKTAPAVRDWGVAMPGLPTDLNSLDSLSTAVGDRPGVVMWYDAWSNGTTFPVTAAQSLAAAGEKVTVTWEPWDPAAGVTQASYSNARIAGGAFDSYIRAYAQSVKSYGKPVTIRFAHEMNGTWYPWSPGVNNNTAADYVAAFRHVHDVFVAQRVTNVTWAWVPNIPYAGSTPLSSVYPGDAYVDQVGLDGYNFGTTQTWSAWTSFWDLFGPGVAQLRTLTKRPIWLGEVGSTEIGGDKGAWIRDMFASLAAHPEITGFTWFNYNKETDWRIDSSAVSLSAFRAGLTSYR